MKTTIFCCVALITLSISGNAQQSATQPTPPTKLEMIEASTGRVLIRDYGRIGQKAGSINGSSVEVEALEIIDPVNQMKLYGIVITAREVGSSIKAERAYVDYEEIDPLLKAIDYLVKVDGSQTTLSRFDAHYRTNGGLDIDVCSDRSGLRASVTAGEVGRATVTFSMNDFASVRDMIDAAKKKLDTLKQ